MESTTDNTTALYDPRNGDLSLQVVELHHGPGANDLDRTNYFNVVLIGDGHGSVAVDTALHPFAGPCLLFFTPYQQVRVTSNSRHSATAVQFHANFLCIETHHNEVGCNGVLFNDPYGLPSVQLEHDSQREFTDLFERIRTELATGGLAQAELLVSFLKVLLVTATRLKLKQTGMTSGTSNCRRPPILDALTELIETNYRSIHAPAEYAERLHTTPKSLGRLVKEHFGKTLTDLIRERLLKHAKWQLLHTLRSVKEIARELGFDDELYFSRLFKKTTGYSPTFFREFETAIRGGSNLSIPSTDPSIPRKAASDKNAGDAPA